MSKLDELRTSNAERIRALAAKRVEVNNLTAARLMHLEQAFFDGEPPEEYELEWEKKLAAILDEAETQAAELLGGPKLHLA